jgi:hypothetical protein
MDGNSKASQREALLFDAALVMFGLFEGINEPRQTRFVVCCFILVDDAFGGKLVKQLCRLA